MFRRREIQTSPTATVLCWRKRFVKRPIVCGRAQNAKSWSFESGQSGRLNSAISRSGSLTRAQNGI